jgi:hypothetical protein
MRRAVPAIIAIGVLCVAGFADAGYRAVKFKGDIGSAGAGQNLSFTYERLSARESLVGNARIRDLIVQCTKPGSSEPVDGVLSVFHQPTTAWVVNKRKKIGGLKNFRKVWKGNGVPIEAPDESTRFTGKRAVLAGTFRKRFKRARGSFAIRWKEIDADSREVRFECETRTGWKARAK